MDSFHGQRNEIEMTHDLPRHDGQSHFDSRATLPCKSQVRLTRDKCSKQIQFCSVPRTLHVRAAVQIACAIGEAIEALTAGLQKISAQLAAASPSGGGLETSKPAPQVVNNP
jgi:hypothetical protein